MQSHIASFPVHSHIQFCFQEQSKKQRGRNDLGTRLVYHVYLWHSFKLIASEIKGVELCESGEGGESGELVGVEEEAPEMWAAEEWGD